MTITLTREEMLGIVAGEIQRRFGVKPDSISLNEVYADHSGKGVLQYEVVVDAEVAIG